MANIELKVRVDCYHCTTHKGDTFYCTLHKKFYKSFTKCNTTCKLGADRIHAIEESVRIVVEESKRKAYHV